MRSVPSSRLQLTPSEWLETLDRTSPSVTPDMGEIEAGGYSVVARDKV